jgi:predicted 2-oxoglutarate/Fe(II)-dependent dioxygenase YbiX
MNCSISKDTSLSSFIQIFDNLVSESLCNNIIEEYGTDFDVWEPSAIVGSTLDPNKVNKLVRSSDNVNISDQTVINKNYEARSLLDKEVFNCVSNGIQKYSNMYKDIKVTTDTGYSLLRYVAGDYYKEHVDSFNPKHVTQNELGDLAVLGCREISCVIQLNDNFEGGGLSFFGDTYRLPVKTGSVVYFPSSFMYPHQALPVTKGTRYSIVTWFS